ncbi:MAG: thiamine phosphate synthase [Myxococcota bacterium]
MILPPIIGISSGDGRLDPILAAIDAGLPALILREPCLSARDAQRFVAALHPLLKENLIIHRKTSGADGFGLPIHLPGGVSPAPYISDARHVGVSAHSIAALQTAQDAGCAYATYSPVYSPTSKPEDRRPTLGIAGFAAGAAAVTIPVVALGGINAERAVNCFRAGAAAVAGIGAFFQPKEIRRLIAAGKRNVKWRSGVDAV